MRRKNTFERYEQTPKVQNVIRLFKALGPPPEVPLPSDFRAEVWEQIRQQDAPRTPLAWVARRLRPYIVPALAVLLLLSLGGNVWLGLRTFGLLRRDNGQATDQIPEHANGEGLFNAYRFQASMQSATDFGTSGSVMRACTMRVSGTFPKSLCRMSRRK